MQVTIPPALEEFVRSKVAAGEFPSPDEVVSEGLRLLQSDDEWKKEAREKIEIGWQQAKSGQLLTPEQVRENLAAGKAAWRRKKIAQ